ncbi:Glycosyl hydrolases family 17 [Musa troglodytarum]|uniref:Glycosyl hydrolases family 17 n=1 Tax=Musa troglodytarum TaxID=320322 RepID=A0A9E7GTP2_9LILI|nr:Glycosyl hydrolases family 17 [Musa troglodytarum]
MILYLIRVTSKMTEKLLFSCSINKFTDVYMCLYPCVNRPKELIPWVGDRACFPHGLSPPPPPSPSPPTNPSLGSLLSFRRRCCGGVSNSEGVEESGRWHAPGQRKHPLPTVVTHGISSDAPAAVLIAVFLLVFVLVLVCPPSPSLPLAKKGKMSNSRLPLFFCSLFVFLLPRHGLLKVDAFSGTYGINYGRIADNLPPPESVVTLLKAARIKNVRIFDSDHSVIKAFKGSGIELTVAIPNEHLRDISVYEDRAMSWVKENVQPFLPGTRIRGIAVGNEVLGGGDQELAQVLFGAIKNVYNALDRLQLSHEIEVSTPHSESVFASSFPPSSCTFNEEVLVLMKPILDFFSQIGSPFYINAYPFIAYKNEPEHIDINYALFQSNAGIHDAKTDLHYDNMWTIKVSPNDDNKRVKKNIVPNVFGFGSKQMASQCVRRGLLDNNSVFLRWCLTKSLSRVTRSPPLRLGVID